MIITDKWILDTSTSIPIVSCQYADLNITTVKAVLLLPLKGSYGFSWKCFKENYVGTDKSACVGLVLFIARRL